jgi:starch synthase
MKIVMVASEALPFIKTGGLADVVYSLSKQLVSLHHEVSIIIPMYESMLFKPQNLDFIGTSDVYLSWRKQQASFYHHADAGIHYYLISNDYYFKRQQPYGYGDDGERFAFFSLAVRSLLKLLKHPIDVIHVHDWQCGMLPALIKEQDAQHPHFVKTKFVLTIHNPAFQGWLDRGLLWDFYNLPFHLYESGKLRFHEGVSTLKSAIVYADKVTTVSPTHAKELLTEVGGYGLHDILSYIGEDFSGILNGIDESWNPKHDAYLHHPYDPKNVTSGKQKNKERLFRDYKLKDPHRPLFGLVSRLTWQKGINLILANLHWLIQEGGSVIVLGSGEPPLTFELDLMAKKYPEQLVFIQGYDERLAHHIYAASDFFLMPSLFEPCGISQMISLRYGTLPLVRKTGGLVDTVQPWNVSQPNIRNATGFMFDAYTAQAMQMALREALEMYRNPAMLHTMIENGFQQDHGWLQSADQYVRLYASLFNKKSAKIN